VTACSEDDARRLQALYQIPTEKMLMVPNGVDMDTVAYSPWQDRLRYQKRQNLDGVKIAVFMGSWHGPNIEALEEIIKLATHMRAGVDAEWQFWIMGSVCKYLQTAIREGRIAGLPDNIRLLGMLPESEKAVVLASANVALNPMITGSGSNLKMMEYAAAGVPILSTPFGNRGLVYRAGVDIVECELPKFAQSLRHWDGDGSRWMSESAYQLTAQAYRWRSIAENYVKSLLVLLST
jgi:glycosyltransferase involved in cell wall biosynthesis